MNPATRAASAAVQRSVDITPTGLQLRNTGARVQLYCGSVQYWQLERRLWRDVLQRVRGLGFHCVETYIPWSVHETERGVFDFSGNRDVAAFLELCGDVGLYVCARPGPHINAELTEFGFPSRVIHDPAMQARTSTGTPAIHLIPPKAFPIISYSSPAFYEAVSEWFDVVAPLIARYQYPDGPIVLVQADNEHSYFFKLTPYDVDYSDAAVDEYRRFLADKYGGNPPIVEPPRRFEPLDEHGAPRYLDWAEAKERHLTDGVARVAEMLRQRGIDRVPLSHNTPGHFGVPYNHPAMESVVDVQGIDFYVQRDAYEYLKRGCLYLTGTSRMPFIPEFGAGTWPWWPPTETADLEASALTALMHGIKAFNYYMVVERDRWLGSPIGRRGDVREDRAAVFRKLLAFLEETDWANVRRRIDFLLLHVRDYDRLRFAAQIVSPPFFPDQLGPLHGLARHQTVAQSPFPGTDDSWSREAYEVLNEQHFQFALGDTESDLAWLQRFPMLVAPGYELLSGKTQSKLRQYVEAGGILVLGPELPTRDEGMHELGLLAEVADAITVVTPDALPGTLRALGLTQRFALDCSAIDIAEHSGPNEDYVFLANRTDRPQTGTLRWAGAREFRDLWGSGRVVTADQLDLVLAPAEIQVWAVRC